MTTRKPPKPEPLSPGRRLRNARKARDLTQADLAELLGVTPGRISAVERGAVSPSIAWLSRAAKAIGVEATSLSPELALIHGRSADVVRFVRKDWGDGPLWCPVSAEDRAIVDRTLGRPVPMAVAVLELAAAGVDVHVLSGLRKGD